MILLPNRKLWTPRQGLPFRQRGFLLNPYRFGSFPLIAATNNGTDHTGTATTTTVQLPAGFTSGMLGLIVLDFNSSPGSVTATGWTVVTIGGSDRIVYLYRFADGTEGASIVVNHSTSAVRAWSARILGAHGSSAPEKGTESTATSVNPDPPSVTPSWGTANTMWLAPIIVTGSSLSSYPANYINNQYSQFAASPCIALATRSVRAATEDPGTYTLGSSVAWRASTLAIRPSA